MEPNNGNFLRLLRIAHHQILHIESIVVSFIESLQVTILNRLIKYTSLILAHWKNGTGSEFGNEASYSLYLSGRIYSRAVKYSFCLM